jgi:hypothetical protein
MWSTNGDRGAAARVTALHFRYTPPRVMRTAVTARAFNAGSIDQVGSTLTPSLALTISRIASVNCTNDTCAGSTPAGLMISRTM